jgi:hypothetical protein
MSDEKDDPILTVLPLPPGFVLTNHSVTIGRGFFNERGEWEEEFITYREPTKEEGTKE